MPKYYDEDDGEMYGGMNDDIMFSDPEEFVNYDMYGGWNDDVMFSDPEEFVNYDMYGGKAADATKKRSYKVVDSYPEYTSKSGGYFKGRIPSEAARRIAGRLARVAKAKGSVSTVYFLMEEITRSSDHKNFAYMFPMAGVKLTKKNVGASASPATVVQGVKLQKITVEDFHARMTSKPRAR